MTKAELRRWARAERAGLDIARISARINAHLAGFLAERGAKNVLLYSAFRSEPDPRGLADLHPARYYLPRTDGERIRVHPLPCELVQHRFGMLEPSTAAPEAEASVLDAVLVPGLCFDRGGHRLGYGAGYYDRFLDGLGEGVLTVGVVPKALLVDELPSDPWDVPVRFLATESGVAEAG